MPHARDVCLSIRVSHACAPVAFAVIIAIAIIVALVHQQRLSVVTSDGMHYYRASINIAIT